MNRPTFNRVRALLLAGCATIAISPAIAAAQSTAPVEFSIPAQELNRSLNQFARQSDRLIVFRTDTAVGKIAPAINGSLPPEQALAMLLEGTGLTWRREGDAYMVVQGAEGGSPQGASAAGGGAEVEALVVTAQKREEAIQDVPIAISAFTQKALEEQKIEGGFDLLKAIPNVTFSKSNFTSYNFSIRGVGTKAISATTDPGVAVAFNNTTLIQNRLFAQEYFDVERVEVLRGPQGTLYGRNATSGVINVISAKPKLGEFEGSLKAEVGNYDAKRLVGMLNVPLGDTLAIRIAGAGTQRTGFDYNEVTGNNINGRDLWSTRVTVGFEPVPQLRVNLLWEHFEEDDNRARTSKQLCHRDPGPATVGGVPASIPNRPGAADPINTLLTPAVFSQACLPGSLYDDGAYDAPNGLALPFIFAPLAIGGDCGDGCFTFGSIGNVGSDQKALLLYKDPYGGLQQSRDLRTIASIKDPRYRAKADVYDLTIDFDITDALTITSQTVYNEDQVYSFQDFNRFNSAPVFFDSAQLTTAGGNIARGFDITRGGVYCDPQLGCSDKVVGFDISQSEGTQFSQEIRLASDFDGPINFSLGANYTKFDTVVDYYVFYNLITALTELFPFFSPIGEGICPRSGWYQEFGVSGNGPITAGDPNATCPYIDPNPIDTSKNFEGDGHNYFRSKNPYKLTSQAAFGELYWNINDTLKLTAGLRYTDDRKHFTPVPSQVLLAGGWNTGGVVSRGYPEEEPIRQKWGEWTGRLGIDWKPELPFTDDTMLYAFYSHGYKGGGANPPTPDFATREETLAFILANHCLSGGEPLPAGETPQPGTNCQVATGYQPFVDRYSNPEVQDLLRLTAVEYGPTFEPEFVDAFEIGAKNTLLGGAMTFNATGFFYDYKDYQVSQIRDRTAVNENFDATIWGLEFETVFAPSRNLRFNANLGYLDTKIADGEASIDIMNRTQGNPNYVLVKPWVQFPSNCIIPVPVAVAWLQYDPTNNGSWGMQGCAIPGTQAGLFSLNGFRNIDPNPLLVPDSNYDPFGIGFYNPLGVDADGNLLYPEINGGAGIRDELGGNELPNAPHWTMNVGAQYGRDILDGSWRVVMRGDAYWQSQSFARVYNAVNDKLHGWYNLNASVRLENEDLGLAAEFYVKNLLDKSPITDAFLNSDDTGLTTNVFVLDPRLVGFSLRKTF